MSKNTSYFWRVNSINENDTSDWSSVWKFITEDVQIHVNNDYFSKSKELLVSPNPVFDILNIKYDTADFPKSLKIYDLIGNVVLQVEISSPYSMIDVSSLCSGVYIINIDDKKEVIIKY